MREPHAITRARERYGLELSFGDLVELNRRLAAGEGVVQARYAPNAEWRYVVVKGVACRVAYDLVDQRVLSFLPPRKARPRRGKQRRRRIGKGGRPTW